MKEESDSKQEGRKEGTGRKDGTEDEAMLKEVGRILRKMDGPTITPWKR